MAIDDDRDDTGEAGGDRDDLVIRTLGDVGARLVGDAVSGLGRDELSERWSRELQRVETERCGLPERPEPADPASAERIQWQRYTLSELLSVESDRRPRPEPAMVFGHRVARYLEALADGEPTDAVGALLSVGAETGRPTATEQALRVVAAAAHPLRVHRSIRATVDHHSAVLDSLNVMDLDYPRLRGRTRHLIDEMGIAELLGDGEFGDRAAVRDEGGQSGAVPWSDQLAEAVANLNLTWPILIPGDTGDAVDAGDAGAEPDKPAEPAEHPDQAAGTFVNVGLSEVDRPATSLRERPLAPGDQVDVWVGIGPKSDEALGGAVNPIDPAYLTDGSELEVVLFPDDAVEIAPQGTLGAFRVATRGDFRVSRHAEGAVNTERPESATRLYARLTLPSQTGTWRLRVGVYLRGVLLQMLQVTLPVGLGEPVSTRTTYELVHDLGPAEAFESLRTPTVTVYANAGEETHDFAFYLPNGDQPSMSKLVHLDATQVVKMTANARLRLRRVSWRKKSATKPAPDEAQPETGEEEPTSEDVEMPGDASFVRKGERFVSGGPDHLNLRSALIELAIGGRNLWQEFAAAIEPGPEFRDAFRAAVRTPGQVQLAIKAAPDLIVPLQILYDLPLDTSGPTYLKVCQATDAWLDAPAGDPPCLTSDCADAGNDQRVCLAGFWGLRHAISTSPAQRRAWEPTVPTPSPPHATVARTADTRLNSYWPAHKTQLSHLMHLAPAQPAGTSTAVFDSLREDRSVIAYFLAHVEYVDSAPRIVFNSALPRGALNVTTLDGVDLSASRPLVFINACASAGVSPNRLLALVNGFMEVGASGAVGTEISVFSDTATTFAEEMLAAYTSAVPLGESMRRGRLELLRRGNPLGFVYTCFGLHDLRLVLTDTPERAAVPAAP